MESSIGKQQAQATLEVRGDYHSPLFEMHMTKGVLCNTDENFQVFQRPIQNKEPDRRTASSIIYLDVSILLINLLFGFYFFTEMTISKK